MERLTFAVSGSRVEGRTLSGVAHVYGTTTGKYGGHRFQPGTFSKSIKAGTVASFAFHDENKLLTTQKAGGLRLSDSPQGLGFEIDLPEGVSYAEDLRALVASGVEIGMSFQFDMARGVSSRQNGVRVWSDGPLLSVDPVLDAGPVHPAFEGTSVSLYSDDVALAATATRIRARVRTNDLGKSQPPA
jgi:HK97 family phage prohead protease